MSDVKKWVKMMDDTAISPKVTGVTLNAVMAGDESSMAALGLELKLFCEKHEGQMKGAKLNQVYCINALTQASMNKIIEEVKPQDGTDFGNAIQAIAKAGTPLCCVLGQDGIDQIIADAPSSTGSSREDYEAAKDAVPGVSVLGGDAHAFFTAIKKPKKKPNES